jgi:hypothetical protein
MGFFLISNPNLESKKSCKFPLVKKKVSKNFRQSKFSIAQQAPSDWLKSDVLRGANFAMLAFL